MAVTVASLKEDTVVKVATNVTAGSINRHRKFGREFTYIATARATAAAAPSASEMLNEGYKLFQLHPEQEIINNDTPIDIYILCNDGGRPGDHGFLVIWT